MRSSAPPAPSLARAVLARLAELHRPERPVRRPSRAGQRQSQMRHARRLRLLGRLSTSLVGKVNSPLEKQKADQWRSLRKPMQKTVQALVGRPWIDSGRMVIGSRPKAIRSSLCIRSVAGGLALLWQIYSGCFSSLIQDRQYGHR